MSKKKILFVVPYFEIGGTMTSLRNLLPLLDKERFDVSVYALTDSGEGYRDLMPYARVMGHSVRAERKNAPRKAGYKQRLFSGIKKVVRLLSRTGIDLSPIWFRKQGRALSAGRYDAVIAFQEGQTTRMASCIEAPLRIAWVHSMYSRLLEMGGNRYDAAYSAYDRIVCVSETAADNLRSVRPEWSDRIRVVYNALNTERIMEMAAEEREMPAGLNLVSVGRIDPVKRFSEIPRIAAELQRSGISFHWTVIGGTADEAEAERLRSNIEGLKMGDSVSWIGPQANPYPYVKQADALVCLSRSETFNYTIAEAFCLGTPVVTTDFSSALEFVSDGLTGLISPINDIDHAIARILTEEPLRETIKANLAHTIPLNEKTIIQFNALLRD